MSRRVCLRLRHELKSVSLNYLGRPEPSAGRSHQPPAMASLLCAFSLLHHPPCREYVETDSQTTHPTTTALRISGNSQSLNPWYQADTEHDKCQVQQWIYFTSVTFYLLLPSLIRPLGLISIKTNTRESGDIYLIHELLRDFQDIFPQPSSNIWDGKRWVECSVAEPQLDEMRYSCYFYPVIVV